MLANFLWGNSAEGTKKHWSTWKSLCLPTNENGLGFRRVADIVHAYDYKLWWKFRTATNVWAKFLWSLEPNIRAKTALKRTFHIEADAMQCSKLLSQSGREEEWIWRLNESGKFSLSSAYQRLRWRGISNNFSKYIWNESIPLKISYFMWRLINFYLPFPDVLEKFNLHLPSKCNFCSNHSESMLHVFYNCPFSLNLWRICLEKLNIKERLPSSLMETLEILWVNNSFKGLHRILLSIFPSLLIWEIWKSRNAAFFDNKKTSCGSILRSLDIAYNEISHSRKLFAETKNDQTLVQQSFGKFFTIKSKKNMKVISWKFPPVGFLKLNIDGAFKDGVGAGGGYILRDETGNLVEAGAVRLKSTSAMDAELDALYIGVQRCIALGLQNVEVESDCQRLVLSLVGNDEYPWRWRGKMREISELLKSKGYDVKHIYRETNSVADTLAKIGIYTRVCALFNVIEDLPDRARGSLILEKQNVKYVRL